MRRGRRWARWVAPALVVPALAIQLVPVQRTNPPVEADVGAPPEVDRILRRACYDCHSNETSWPWYAYVAPASWFVTGHVNEARGDLNFSHWPAFDLDEQDHAFDDIRKQVKSEAMPLPSYLWLHPEARLDERERKILIDWASPGPPPGEIGSD